MKIILSRKGFDSANGGCPSPIMPDGTLLSLPIPSEDAEEYENLEHQGMKYSDILASLAPKRSFSHCHLDPDIRQDCRSSQPVGWAPAFGQIGAAQGVLNHAGVAPGDIFLFFGWFRRTELFSGGVRFAGRQTGSFYDHSDLHVIYGYMQIGEIITDPRRISEYYWHPHAGKRFLGNRTNTLYIPSERLSLSPGMKGWGTLNFRQDRVLTMENRKRGTWVCRSFLLPEHIFGNRKNAAEAPGLYYGGIWQELVVSESEGLLDWVKQIIE